MATVTELDAKALVDILVDKLSEIKAKTLCYTLGRGFRGTIGHAASHAS